MIDIRNPELLRYVRSELRPARTAIITGGSLFGALLLALFVSANMDPQSLYTQRYWQDVYGAIVVASSIVLVLWSLLNTSQAVVSERTHRTFDFWRTTRLSPITLAIGKLFGAPICAWLQFATILPVAVVLGALAGYGVTTVIGVFLVVGLCNTTLSAVALCLSMRSQDLRRATMMIFLLALGFFPAFTSVRMIARSGDIEQNAWTALNPIAGLAGWHYGVIAKVALFGHAVPSLLVTIGLCAVILSWCMTALDRSIKLEPDQSSLFSPTQVVTISTCFYLFNYAAFQPLSQRANRYGLDEQAMASNTFSGLLVVGILSAAICLYFTLVATLHTRDRLRQELRVRQPRQIALMTIAPWLVTGALGLFAALLMIAKDRGFYPEEPVQWVGIVAMYVAISVYAVRDGMFLQWMIAQRVKAPVLKGSVLLGAYYTGCSITSAVLLGPRNMWQALRWLTPFSGDPIRPSVEPVWLLILFLVPPIATTALLAMGVFRKMQRASQHVTSPIQA
jgi:hypothetical protein